MRRVPARDHGFAARRSSAWSARSSPAVAGRSRRCHRGAIAIADRARPDAPAPSADSAPPAAARTPSGGDSVGQNVVHLAGGVAEGRIRHVIEHCGRIFAEEAPPDSPFPGQRLLYLGDDQRGVALEVLAITVERDDGPDDLLVIHAMKLRTKYLDQYIEALPCRR